MIAHAQRLDEPGQGECEEEAGDATDRGAVRHQDTGGIQGSAGQGELGPGVISYLDNIDRV